MDNEKFQLVFFSVKLNKDIKNKKKKFLIAEMKFKEKKKKNKNLERNRKLINQKYFGLCLTFYFIEFIFEFNSIVPLSFFFSFIFHGFFVIKVQKFKICLASIESVSSCERAQIKLLIWFYIHLLHKFLKKFL